MKVDFSLLDEQMMRLAIDQARLAGASGEVPVGALVLDASANILAKSGNNCIASHDPAGHAEMIALRRAARMQKNYRLPGATLYVTLEPCAMCAALLVHARIKRLVFGAFDPKAGAVASVYKIGNDGLLNHGFTVAGGLFAEECGGLLQDFFQQRRKISIAKKCQTV